LDDPLLVSQIWRAFSSSFSHVDLLHLVMNMLSLYQVGWLEEFYGSVLYAQLSLSLVILTMIVNFVTYHVLITRFRKEQYITVCGVGYSCVLFAWLVVSTSKSPKYCPLPGLQKLCLPTWQIPVPASGFKLPFSAAPFVLLLAMHYLVPKASFVGHLAGIVVGYPLSWGGLSWCGPEALVRVFVVVVMLRELCFGTDRRIVTLGSSASAPDAHTAADVPLPLHDGGRSKLLLAAAATNLILTCVQLSSLSWCEHLGKQCSSVGVVMLFSVAGHRWCGLCCCSRCW
jgi:membrane associated rhomboid family serine protease